TPTTSVGSRSGVNWMRRTEPSTTLPMARARRVLPTPGTSSSRTWPPASRAMSESPTASSLPSSTVFMAVRAREVRCWTHSMCCAPITELVCVPSWLIDIPSIVPYGRHSGHTRFSQVPRAPPASTTDAPTRLHGSRPTRLPTFLHTDPPLPSPHRSTSATEILEIGEFSRISAHERSLAEVARPSVRTLPGRPPRPPATHRWEKIPTFLHLPDLGKRTSLNTDGVKGWNTWREVEYCGCYRSRWVSKGVRRHVLGHSYAEARRQGSPHPARKVPRGAVARTRTHPWPGELTHPVPHHGVPSRARANPERAEDEQGSPRLPACVPVGGICGPTGQTGTHHGPEHIAAVRITDTGSRSDRHGQPSRDLGRTDLGGLPRRRSAGLRRTRGGGDSRSDLILLGP